MTRRTLAEIYDQIALEKANMSTLNSWYTDTNNTSTVLDDHQTLLEDLGSSSKVAIWRLLIWIVAVAIFIHEGLWFVFKGEVEADIARHMPHGERWYQEESLKFQYGDQLVWNTATRRYEYETYDANKLIIKRAATESNNGMVAIKVATLLNGDLAPLSTLQKIAFQAFWSRYRDAGVVINIITANPDLLKLSHQIYYDPLVLSSDGSLISDSSVKPVEDAINSYIATLDFNGRFSLEHCDAAIRAAEGVVDFKRLSADSKYGANNYSSIDVSIIAYSGYFIIDPDNTLTDLITYTANV
ncbi:MAG: hypothetical protein QM503_04495 [Bacteroidota bacterium]